MKNALDMAFQVLDEDDAGYLDRVRHVLANELAALTQVVYVVKVDNWFGRNWLQFAGKVLGALGVWRYELTVPPFHPNRVMFEQCFKLNSVGELLLDSTAHVLHRHQHSAENLRRRLDGMTESGTFIWYSGKTKRNGRGSLMVYVVAPHEQAERYMEFARDEHGDWRTIHNEVHHGRPVLSEDKRSAVRHRRRPAGAHE